MNRLSAQVQHLRPLTFDPLQPPTCTLTFFAMLYLVERKSKKKPKLYDAPRSWNYALWLLSRRAYTAKEIRDKLVKKEATPEVIEQTLERLVERKFVNDAEYAASYVRSRRTQKGPIVLRQALFRKGVSEEVVSDALLELDEDSQSETATELLTKNVWRFNKDDPRKNYAKAYAFLARRGFGSDVVKQAIEASGIFDEDD